MPDEEEITCEYGYYPYCPLCEHGLVIQEEWMLEDNCKWICLLDKEHKRGGAEDGLEDLHTAGKRD